MRRAGVRILAGLAGVALLVAVAPMAEAQRGSGRGRAGRPSEPASPAPPAPKEALGPGEYSLDFGQVLEAVNRGEGRQALAYYERVAAQAEQRGDRIVAARAAGAAAAAATRLGLFQKAILSGTRSIELFKSVELAPPDQARLASTYSQLGVSYRAVGDLVQARRVLEEGLAFAESRARYRDPHQRGDARHGRGPGPGSRSRRG